jgi:hypothetical protein
MTRDAAPEYFESVSRIRTHGTVGHAAASSPYRVWIPLVVCGASTWRASCRSKSRTETSRNLSRMNQSRMMPTVCHHREKNAPSRHHRDLRSLISSPNLHTFDQHALLFTIVICFLQQDSSSSQYTTLASCFKEAWLYNFSYHVFTTSSTRLYGDGRRNLLEMERGRFFQNAR